MSLPPLHQSTLKLPTPPSAGGIVLQPVGGATAGMRCIHFTSNSAKNLMLLVHYRMCVYAPVPLTHSQCLGATDTLKHIRMCVL